MDLLPSPEQIEITDSSAAFLGDRMSISLTRTLLDADCNFDRAAWLAAAELGWLGLGLPEHLGGVGGGLADEVLLFREIGRSLAPGPFLSSVLGARVAAFGGRPDLATAIVAGAPVGLAVPGTLDALGPDGAVDGVLQLLDAEGELVLLATPGRAVLLEVGAFENVTAVPCFDPAVRVKTATARRIVPLVTVASELDPVERRGHVLAAAMLTGVVEAARDISAEHAKNRAQFGRPIGVNQAIKHPCADMAVRAQLALAQTLFAALANDERREDAEFHALSAHVVAAEAAEFATAGTIQVLGGMGITFEHDAHLYVRRAFVLATLFGGASTQLTRLLDLPEPR